MAITVHKYAGDFETTTDTQDVRVWASCLVDIDTIETSFVGNDIDSFFDYLSSRNSVVFLHNLKFDGEFILSYLLTHGYTYDKDGTKAPKTFSSLITDDGIFYSITVIFAKKNKKYKKVVFQDSYKKLPFKVSVIAKAFELEDRKLKIDYEAYRPIGHILTPDEEDYIVADCRIVAQALKIQFAQGLKKMTNASDAMNGYKEIVGNNNFSKWFPVLPVELDADIRRAYKGGFVYLNPLFRDRRVAGGITLDVNSLYPSRMRTCLLPYGYPMYFEGRPEPDENYPLYIVHMKCTFKLKPKHIPTIQLKNNRRYVETEYLTTSEDADGIDEPVEMWLTNVDYELMLEHYDIADETYINGYKFKGTRGMFNQYIDYWMHIKETTTGAIKQLSKLQLNSLYGRFALNPKAFQKLPYIDENGIVRYKVINDKKSADEFGVPEPELREPVYTAMGCFITAESRALTIRSAQSVYDRFIYADTDSLHLVGEDIPEGIEVHKSKLGAWKHEGTFVDSKYIRAKTYMETMREELEDCLKNYSKCLTKTFEVWRTSSGITWYNTKVTCAGMPDNLKEDVTYENFHSGSTFEGKLMPKRYKGGIVLTPSTFTIK